MNVPNLSPYDFGSQSKRGRIVPLFPEYSDYEERKKEIAAMNLSPDEYARAIRDLADELGL